MKLHNMNDKTTTTMTSDNNWQRQRSAIDGSCPSEGYKLTSNSFVFARFLILTMLLCLVGGGSKWGVGLLVV